MYVHVYVHMYMSVVFACMHAHARTCTISIVLVLFYRNAFQNALRTDGEHSTTALSVAVWNRKPQVSREKSPTSCVYVPVHTKNV